MRDKQLQLQAFYTTPQSCYIHTFTFMHKKQAALLQIKKITMKLLS